MKLIVSPTEKKVILAVSVVAGILLYILNRKYTVISDIVFENDEPSEITIKSGFIFPERVTLKTDTVRTVTNKRYPYTFKLIGLALYKNGQKVRDLKTDSYYTQNKTSPMGRI